MKVDAWTHVLTPSYRRHLETSRHQGIGPYLLSQRALHDLDFRRQAMEAYGDYQQILTPIPSQVLGGLDDPTLIDLVKRNNEDMAEIVKRHPDSFAGFAAATPLRDADAATIEAIRAVRELGALGVQLEEDPVNLPLHESRYEPLFAALEDLGAGVWLHPIRSPATPGIPTESAPFALWQAFTWVFDTTITISRLIFAGLYERNPGVKLIAHHGGGMIPHFSGRIELIPTFTAMDPTLKDALDRLHRPPIEYFKMIYVDTAMFGAPHGVRCVLEFFDSDHVLFGTDSPFDSRAGSYFIPATISDIEHAIDDATARAAVFEGNIRQLLSSRM